MSELDQYVLMLGRAEIEFEKTVQAGVSDGTTTITVTRGYAGFVLTHTFDACGDLVDCGAYE